MFSPTIYLAGPIKGLTFEQAVGWRHRSREVLERHFGFRCIDPVERSLADHDGVLDCNSNLGLMSSQKAIVAKDRNHVLQRADALLVYLDNAPHVSIGTMIELGWADAKRIPIVTVMGPDNVHNHSFVREISGWVVPNLDDAYGVLYALFTE